MQNKDDHIEVGQNKPTDGKEIKRSHKKQQTAHWHTEESYENTKLGVNIFVQRTWCRPLPSLCILLHYLSIQMSFACGGWRSLFSLSPPLPLALKIFKYLLPLGSFNSKGRNLMDVYI